MSNATERYEKLALRSALAIAYRYPIACKELALVLRIAYSQVPKNLQSLIFQDLLTAFRLLPEMQTSSAVAAANVLLRSAEAALPKQKRNLAVTEFKQAMVACKRRCKPHLEEESAQLPQDVLIHIFSYLDFQSLASAGLVCWSWNWAANDKDLWRLQFIKCFGDANKFQLQLTGRDTVSEENIVDQTNIDWRDAFKRLFLVSGNSSEKLKSNRGYCGHCSTIVWLDHFECSNRHLGLKSENMPIELVTPHQVVEYILGHDDYLRGMSSDSDSESDEGSISRLWAYPKSIGKRSKKHIHNTM